MTTKSISSVNYDSSDSVSGEESEDSFSFDRLPEVVKRRVNALKKLQKEKKKIDEQFFDEIHKLEKRFESLLEPLFQKRSQIVNGILEPNDSDLSSDESEGILSKKEVKETKVLSQIKGVPEFWLSVLKNDKSFYELIEEYDEPILKHLVDIKISRNVEPKKISFEFHFSPNEYFDNKVLVKEFYLSYNSNSNEFLCPISCSGTQINWNKGKDVTTEKIGYKGKKLIKTENKPSFFNFFRQNQFKDTNSDESEDMLKDDWLYAQLLTDRIVPNAILFFTGEISQNEGLEEEESSDPESSYESEESDEN